MGLLEHFFNRGRRHPDTPRPCPTAQIRRIDQETLARLEQAAGEILELSNHDAHIDEQRRGLVVKSGNGYLPYHVAQIIDRVARKYGIFIAVETNGSKT